MGIFSNEFGEITLQLTEKQGSKSPEIHGDDIVIV